MIFKKNLSLLKKKKHAGLFENYRYTFKIKQSLYKMETTCERVGGKSEADTYSFMESMLPMRGLILYSQIFNGSTIIKTAEKASEIFLERKLYKSKSLDKIIHKEFTLLHYPLYWHYDILGGLKILAEGNFINDNRCNDALDLLESKQVSIGGFPAERKYHTKVSDKFSLNADYYN